MKCRANSVNVKVERGLFSTIYARPFINCLLFICKRKIYARSHVKVRDSGNPPFNYPSGPGQWLQTYRISNHNVRESCPDSQFGPKRLHSPKPLLSHIPMCSLNKWLLPSATNKCVNISTAIAQKRFIGPTSRKKQNNQKKPKTSQESFILTLI